MAPESSSALVNWFVNYFTSTHDGSILGAIVYEMFGLQDAFGQVMLNNLQVFGSVFSLVAFTSIATLVEERVLTWRSPVPHGRFTP